MSLRGLSTDKLKNFLITLDANCGLTIRPSPTTVNNFGVLFCIVEAYLSSFGHLEQRLSNISHWLLEKLFSVQLSFCQKLSADCNWKVDWVKETFRGGSRGRVQRSPPPPTWDDLRLSNTTGIPEKSLWYIDVWVKHETGLKKFC